MLTSPDIFFPKIQRVELRAFSLYSRQPNLDLELPGGVFCLAGANGLGKSTFLAALNFGLTGFVPDPSRDYLAVDDYFSHHRTQSSFTEAFFTGRIEERDREAAEISIKLEVRGYTCHISRGIFTPPGLRLFSTDTHASNQSVSAKEDADKSMALERDYKQWMAKHIGLDKFEQYAFLQHLVLTFDERRHLLLWDRPALNDALFLAIGGDPSRADLAAKLRREMEKAGSLARNLQYQATNVSTRIKTIRDELSPAREKPEEETSLSPGEIEESHRVLQERLSSQEEKTSRKRAELRDAELKWTKASAEFSSYSEEYSTEFSLHISEHSHVELHPVVAATLSENECAICGAERVKDALQQRIEAEECPLCHSKLPARKPGTASIERLKEIDDKLASAQNNLNIATESRKRLSREVQAAEERAQALRSELQEFEEIHRETLLALETREAGTISDTLRRLRGELDELLRQKNTKYAERDLKRRELTKLQRDLEEKYSQAEKKFVPLLQRLAEAFLGVDIYVSATSSQALDSFGLALELEMRGSTRRRNFQLSESQKFFLDIALRMALVQYVAAPGSQATLFIDTPEGSLDIAYEARAGLMFAKFAADNHNLLMTANINSSQLLRRLAHECGRERMTLHRMTSWTDLSDVQLAEEALFEEASREIEKALDSAVGQQ